MNTCLHASPFVIPLKDRAIRLNLLIGCSLNRKLNDYEIILNSQFSILNFERQLDKPEFIGEKAHCIENFKSELQKNKVASYCFFLSVLV